jgi:hypothetical protein
MKLAFCVQFIADRIAEDNIGWAYTIHGRFENAYKLLLDKSVGKLSLGRPSGIDGIIILDTILIKLLAD